VADATRSRATDFFEGQLDKGLAAFVAVIEGSHRPCDLPPLGIARWVIVASVVGESLHGP
jgi:hypothetical protein